MERFIVADEELHDTPCQTERYGDRNQQDSIGETINSFSGVSDAYDTIEFGAASVDIDYILGIERDMMQNDPDFQASNSESGGPASELSRNSHTILMDTTRATARQKSDYVWATLQANQESVQSRKQRSVSVYREIGLSVLVKHSHTQLT